MTNNANMNDNNDMNQRDDKTVSPGFHPGEVNVDNPMNEQQKLTAYALGELDGDDAQQIAQLIESDAAAKAEVEAVRAMAGELMTVLAAEPSPGLTDEQRAHIEAGPQKTEETEKTGSGVVFSDSQDVAPVVFTLPAARWAGVGLLAAAALGLAFVWPMMMERADGPAVSDFAIQQDAGGSIFEQGRSAGKDFGGSGGGGFGGGGGGGGEARRAPSALSKEGGVSGDLGQDSEEFKALLDEVTGTHVLARKKADEFGKRAKGEKKDQYAQVIEEMRQDLKNDSPDASDADIERELQVLITTGSNVTLVSPPSTASASDEGERKRRLNSKAGRPVPKSESVRRSGNGGSIFGDPADAPARSVRGHTPADPELIDEAAEQNFGFSGDIPFDGELSEEELKNIKEAIRLAQAIMPNDSPRSEWSREAYARLTDNPFERTVPNPSGDDNLSTFSIDVDTASYANVRRYITSGVLPPAGAVRIEELVNYFDYDYATPSEDAEAPFTVDVQVTSAPWQPKHRLVRIGLKGYEVAMDDRPATNIVFLLDVSGSMSSRNKLPLVKQSINMLIDELNGDDRVGIVTYAGSSGLALDSTYVQDKAEIKSAVNALMPGGSTHGSAGIELAYDVAEQYFIDGGINRVILCTDGDFNIGVSSDDELVRLIENKRKTGVFLSVLGFGTGNFQDEKMEQLSNHGNGTFAYIDSEREAEKVLIDQAAGTLMTIAKDVKIQVDFNPNKVAAYRLIGYANRMLAAQDFNDDTKDAGEIGAGHTVTALYEVVPVGVAIDVPSVEPSKYAAVDAREDGDDAGDTGGSGEDVGLRETASEGGDAGRDVAVAEELGVDDEEITLGVPVELMNSMDDELLTVRLRYKLPDGDASTRFDVAVVDSGVMIDAASADVQFAAAVSAFGMLLRESPYRGHASWAQVLDLAQAGRGDDRHGYRGQFIELVQRAQEIAEARGTKKSE